MNSVYLCTHLIYAQIVSLLMRWVKVDTLCVMCDARDSRIKGRIANHQQTRVYTLFAICSFPANKFSVHFQKVWMWIFPLVMCEVTALRRDHMHHNAHIEVHQPLHTMHSLLIFDVSTHKLRTSHIVYSRLYHLVERSYA